MGSGLGKRSIRMWRLICELGIGKIIYMYNIRSIWAELSEESRGKIVKKANNND